VDHAAAGGFQKIQGSQRRGELGDVNLTYDIGFTKKADVPFIY
jgi:hypothetical protein